MNDKTTPLSQRSAEISSALMIASAATLLLGLEGVTVIAALANGRRPVLMVSRLPAGADSVIKLRYPNGMGGTTIVRAAQFQGCQLEWMHDVPCTQSDAPARIGRPALEVVRG